MARRGGCCSLRPSWYCTACLKLRCLASLKTLAQRVSSPQRTIHLRFLAAHQLHQHLIDQAIVDQGL